MTDKLYYLNKDFEEPYMKPLTWEEIYEHPHKTEILALIGEIKRECQYACNRHRQLGYHEGAKSNGS